MRAYVHVGAAHAPVHVEVAFLFTAHVDKYAGAYLSRPVTCGKRMISSGVGHRGRAIQRRFGDETSGGRHGVDVLFGQRGDEGRRLNGVEKASSLAAPICHKYVCPSISNSGKPPKTTIQAWKTIAIMY